MMVWGMLWSSWSFAGPNVSPRQIYEWLEQGAIFSISEQNISNLFCASWTSESENATKYLKNFHETFEEAEKERKLIYKDMVEAIWVKQDQCVVLVSFPDLRRFFIFEAEVLDSENPILKVKETKDDLGQGYRWRFALLWSPHFSRENISFVEGTIWEKQELRSSDMIFYAMDFRAYWKEAYEQKSLLMKFFASSVKRSLKASTSGQIYREQEFQYRLDLIAQTNITWEHDGTLRPFVGAGLYHRQKTFWYETTQSTLGRRSIDEYGGLVLYRLVSGRRSSQQKELSLEYAFSIFLKNPEDFHFKMRSTHEFQASFLLHKKDNRLVWGPYLFYLIQHRKIFPQGSTSVRVDQRLKQEEKGLGLKIGLSF
jgi:hypothetical protein